MYNWQQDMSIEQQFALLAMKENRNTVKCANLFATVQQKIYLFSGPKIPHFKMIKRLNINKLLGNKYENLINLQILRPWLSKRNVVTNFNQFFQCYRNVFSDC